MIHYKRYIINIQFYSFFIYKTGVLYIVGIDFRKGPVKYMAIGT